MNLILSMFSATIQADSWWYTLTEAFRTPLYQLPLPIQIGLLVCLIVIAFTIATYILITFGRWWGYIKDRRESRLLLNLRDLLLEHVVLHPEQERKRVENIAFPLNDFRKLGLHKKWVRKRLVTEILKYRQNFSGKVSELLKKLYLDLKLDRYARKRLKKNNEKTVVTALNELLHMGITVDSSRIDLLVRSKNRYKREAARMYKVGFDPDSELFDFLENKSAPLLPWEQFELFRTVSQRENLTPPPPDFSRWITPESHDTVISFCLKMAVHYQQSDVAVSILKMLTTSNEKLRGECINALGKLMAEEAEEELVRIYEHQPPSCRMEILKALGRIGSGRQLRFLQRQFEREESVTLKKHAARSVVSHKKQRQDYQENLRKTASANELVILDHVVNPMLNYS